MFKPKDRVCFAKSNVQFDYTLGPKGCKRFTTDFGDKLTNIFSLAFDVLLVLL